MDIIIAGGGVAAFESALAARKQSADCRITIHSAENILPYRRPALPGLITADEAEFAKMFIRKEEFYRQNNIAVVLNSRLTDMDPAEKTVVFSSGDKASYDSLILATGGRAFIPPIPGADGENVLTLRTFSDLLKLRSRIASGAVKITVIGGGILGLELTDSLLQSSLEVTLLEHAQRLLQRDLSAENSAFMAEKLSSVPGLKVICDVCAAEITPAGTVLSSGEFIPSDLVIFSTGSCPELGGISPDIRTARGILVDESMQTNLPGVYACGDNSQFNGKVCGLYSTSRAMAAVAGTNAAGGCSVYVPKENTIMLNALGFKMSPDGSLVFKS